MSKRLQLRGGTTTEHASFTGAVREVTVDTTKDTLVVHDGSTVGGTALSTAADVAAAIGAIDLTAAIATVIDAAPASLNTLNELAAALGDDANYATTTTTLIGTKLSLAGGALTGPVTTTSTFDGVDIAARDAVLTSTTNTANTGVANAATAQTQANAGVANAATAQGTANAAMPKSGGYFGGNYIVDNYGIGAVGLYDSNKYQSVWAMGSSYLPSADGNSLTGAYGLSWTHTNVGGQSKAGLGHQLLIVQGGSTTTALGTGVWTSGNVTAYSDKRVKENIEVIPNALEKVLQLSGYTFDRTDVDMPRQTGLIAQEVLKVLPEAVSGSEEEHYSVAYGNLVGLLIEAIKEQQTQIETLMDMVGE
jgi:hypothetical protein